MKHALAIALNDLQMRLVERDTLIFSLILPLLFTVIIGVGMDAAFGSADGDNRLPLAVVDQDGGELAQELLASMEASAVIRVERVPAGEAQTLLEDEQVYATLALPADFTRELMAGRPVALVYTFADYNASQRVSEEVQALLSQVSAAVSAAQTAVGEAERLEPFKSDAEREAYFKAALAAAQVQLDPPPAGVQIEIATALEEEGQWAEFTGSHQSSPGMVVMFGMTTMLGVGIVLVQERRLGTLVRLLTTPATKPAILAGKFTGTLLLGLLQTAILVVFGQLVFDVPWGREPLALALVVLAFSLAIVSMGTFFATLVRTEEQAGNIMIGAAMAMAALGGAWWPISITPAAMQTLGHLFPSAWAMDAFTEIIVLGAGLPQVLLEAGILLAYAVVFFALGVWRLKFE